jgi:hypothetical protein
MPADICGHGICRSNILGMFQMIEKKSFLPMSLMFAASSSNFRPSLTYTPSLRHLATMLIPRSALALFALGVSVEATIHVSNDTLSSGSPCACSKLLSRHPELTITQDSDQYAFESTRFWDKRSNMLPTCIFMPTSADEVSFAVGVFHKCDAQFAIRGGGHMNASIKWVTLMSANS